MKCPSCGARLRVHTTRQATTKNRTRRYYLCPMCGQRLTTLELPVEDLKELLDAEEEKKEKRLGF